MSFTMRRLPWVCAVALVGIFASLVAGQDLLETFPTTEFRSYTRAAQDVNIAFTVKAPGRLPTTVPLSLTTVLDRSGSMFGRKLELLKATTKFLVTKLAEADGLHQAGVVIYGDKTLDLVELQPVTRGVAPLMSRAIDSVFAEGQTFLSGGLIRGIEQQKGAENGAIKSVFLFTDGIPTAGLVFPDDILREVRRVRAESGDRITISTFGFGEDLDIQLLKGIAEVGGGQAYIISNEDDIPLAFGDALGGLFSIVAKDIDITFSPKNGAFIKGLRTGGAVTTVNGGTRVSFSNLFTEETRDMVLNLGVPPDVSHIMDIDVEYTDVSRGQRIRRDTIRVFIERRDKVPTVTERKPDPRVPVTTLKFTTAEAIAKAQALIQKGDGEAAASAVAVAQVTVQTSPVKDDPTIKKILADIAKIKSLLEANQAVANARSSVASGDTQAAATAIARAEVIVEMAPAKDDPTIQAIQADIEAIKRILENPDAVEGPQSLPDASDDSVDKLLEIFETALTEQRSSADAEGAELATNTALDTQTRQEIRDETQQAVLEQVSEPGGDLGPASAPQPFVAPAPMVIQALLVDQQLVTEPPEDGPTDLPTVGGLAPEPVDKTETGVVQAPSSTVPAPGPGPSQQILKAPTQSAPQPDEEQPEPPAPTEIDISPVPGFAPQPDSQRQVAKPPMLPSTGEPSAFPEAPEPDSTAEVVDPPTQSMGPESPAFAPGPTDADGAQTTGAEPVFAPSPMEAEAPADNGDIAFAPAPGAFSPAQAPL